MGLVPDYEGVRRSAKKLLQPQSLGLLQPNIQVRQRHSNAVDKKTYFCMIQREFIPKKLVVY